MLLFGLLVYIFTFWVLGICVLLLGLLFIFFSFPQAIFPLNQMSPSACLGGGGITNFRPPRRLIPFFFFPPPLVILIRDAYWHPTRKESGSMAASRTYVEMLETLTRSGYPDPWIPITFMPRVTRPSKKNTADRKSAASSNEKS